MQTPFFRFLWVVLGLLAFVGPVESVFSIDQEEGVPAGRLRLLAKGINLNGVTGRFQPAEAVFLKKAGFTAVRFPLSPDALFDPENPAQPKPLLASVDRTVRVLLDAGLAVIFDPIHGSSSNADWERRLAHEPLFLSKAQTYWEALARHYSQLSPDRIFFEVMNEPHLTTFESIDSSWWGPVQEKLAAAIRRGSPSNTIIVTGERWGGIDGLLGLNPLADKNMVYSFHYYDPMTFTHQGAGWAGPVLAALSGVPYPADDVNVAAPVAALGDTKARKQLQQYGRDGWNSARIQTRLAQVAQWAKAKKVTLFCGEFGVYRKVAAQPDRLRWITDVRRGLESQGVGWAMWDYQTDFGLITYDEPQTRRGAEVDTGALNALGLDSSAAFPQLPGKTSPAHFSSGEVSILDLPVEDWSSYWSRETGAGQALPLTDQEGNQTALKLSHSGTLDWAQSSGFRIPVKSGEELVLSSRAAFDGTGTAALEVVARDAAGQVVSWSYGQFPLVSGPESEVESRFVVAGGISTVEPRWSGTGPSNLLVRGLRVARIGTAPAGGAPSSISLSNSVLNLSFDTATAAFSVTDTRNGTLWTQKAPESGWTAVAAQAEGLQLSVVLADPKSGRPFHLTLDLDPVKPEIGLTLEAAGSLSGEIRYPFPWEPKKGSRLIVSMNEGIAFPVEDQAVSEMRLVGYSGHGLSMGFWGIDLSPSAGDTGPGLLTFLQTPDDGFVDLRRSRGLLMLAPGWEAQKGVLGYPRKLKFVFLDHGGPVAMALDYRQEMARQGRLATLTDKKLSNPNIDRLMGAADVWNWDKDPAPLAADLKAAGLDKVLWSNAETPSVLEKLNTLGFLTGRYDIYQDVMDPAQFPRLRGVQALWPTTAWPSDLVRDKAGNWVRGWEVEARDGTRIPAGVVNDEKILPLAEKRIASDLADHPYLARFIDTTTAAPWREDWDPAHPLTRTQSKQWRMKLLDLVSGRNHLVTGSETGQDAAVPYVAYFEGLESLGPYRIADAGRDMQKIVEPAPDQITRFQLGWKYRLPLWELVYHDCVVAYWYWGDYSNKIPSVWPLRDLFNALYGTPPVYMFDAGFWQSHREQFAASYERASATAKRTAYAAMVDFQWLTADGAVQRTVFSNGVSVIVNFGTADWVMDTGEILAPGAILRSPDQKLSS